MVDTYTKQELLDQAETMSQDVLECSWREALVFIKKNGLEHSVFAGNLYSVLWLAGYDSDGKERN